MQIKMATPRENGGIGAAAIGNIACLIGKTDIIIHGASGRFTCLTSVQVEHNILKVAFVIGFSQKL